MPRPGLLQRLLQGRQLLLPSHEAGEPPRRAGLQTPADRTGPDQLKDLHGLWQPLDWKPPQGVDLDQSPSTSRRVAAVSRILPRGGELLHTRRQVRGLAHGGIVHVQVVANRPHHDFPRVEPHAHLHLQTVGAAHLLRVAAHRRLHGQGSVTGPHGVVFVGHGRAEEGHDAIAQHLVHRALKAVHGVHHALQAGSRRAWAASGSRSRISSVEPLRSANSTVTCLRSPSRALLGVRIFSAR